MSKSNSLAYLATAARGHAFRSASAGACEEPNVKGSDSNSSKKKRSPINRVSQQQFHTQEPEFISPEEERENLRREAEKQTRFETIRATEADPRHPTEMSLEEESFRNIADGIELPGPDLLDENVTQAIRAKRPR